MRVLVIEDDINIADLLRRRLTASYYSVDVAHTGDVGFELACTNDYDLIIVDVMLPKLGGIDVCRRVRGEELDVPILMLTALDTTEDTIKGFDAGADDYVVKPFDFDVLLARVRSLTRRRFNKCTSKIRVADLIVDIACRTACRDGRTIPLSPKEFALLEYLMMNEGKAVTRDAISEHIWDMTFDPQSNVIESLVKSLRDKVDRTYDLSLIHTVRGVGYRLEA